MKCSRDCNLGLKKTCYITCALEIICCGAVAAIALFSWIKQGSKLVYFNYNDEDVSTIKRNELLTTCVTIWILTLILAFDILRAVMSIVLFTAVKKDSATISKSWIAYVIFSLCFSTFILIASFTVSLYTIIAAVLDFSTRLLTSYFVAILYPEIDRMERAFQIRRLSIKAG